MLSGATDIIDTNITSGNYNSALQAQDGTIYFCSNGDNGIKKLVFLLAYSGRGYALLLRHIQYLAGVQSGQQDHLLLGTLTEAQYMQQNEAAIQGNADAKIAQIKVTRNPTVLNSPVRDVDTSTECPVDTFAWRQNICIWHERIQSIGELQISGTVLAPPGFDRIFMTNSGLTYLFSPTQAAYIDHADNTIHYITQHIYSSFAFELKNRVWFGGEDVAGLWYAPIADPYNIQQTELTAGTFYGLGNYGSGFSITAPEFPSSIGNFYFNTGDNTLKPSFTNMPFTASFFSVQFYIMGEPDDGIRVVGAGSVAQTNKTDGTFYGGASFASSTSTNTYKLFFGEEGGVNVLYAGTNASNIAKIDEGHKFNFGWTGLDNALYLCADDGIWRFTETSPGQTQLIQIRSTGSFSKCAIGQDNFMYFAGSEGLLLYNHNNGQFKVLSALPASDILHDADNKIAFLDSVGVKKVWLLNSGNTEDAAAMILQKNSNGAITEYSMLDAISPSYPALSLDEYRQMSESAVNARAQALIDSVPKNGIYNLPTTPAWSHLPDLCVPGEFGFVLPIRGNRIYIDAGAADQSANYNDIFISNSFSLCNIQHTSSGVNFRFIHLLYIDNIEMWREGNNKIIITGLRYPYSSAYVPYYVAFINFPPSQWATIPSAGSASDYNPDYDTVRNMVTNSPYKKLFPAQTTASNSIDISDIYAGDNAKTLALIMVSDNIYRSGGFHTATFEVNGERVQYIHYTGTN